MVQAAVGASYVNHNYVTGTDENAGTNAASPDHPISGKDPFNERFWAVFGQINIPIFGEDNAIPGFRRLQLELSGRYDHYKSVGSTRNPKISLNWEPFEGLLVRGAYGSAFRAPSFGEMSRLSGVQIQPANIGAGAGTNTIQTCPTVGGTPVPGSAGALINPTCSAALMFAPGIFTAGGAGAAMVLRAGKALTPETSKNLSLGFDFIPTGFLSGLNLSLTYWRSETEDFIASVAVRGVADGLINPDYTFTIVLPSDPNFAAAVNDLATNPTTSFDAAFAPNVLWISDGFLRNTGSFVADGFDFNGSYAWDMSGWKLGAWHTGITGTVYNKQTTVSFPGATPTDAFSITASTGTAARFGVPGSSRFRWRAELGWEDSGFMATLFANYKSHYYTTQNPPPASFLVTFPDYTTAVPPYITWDLALGYNTGNDPANDYLKNLDIRFVTLNIFDNPPAFAYRTSTGGGTPLAYDTAVSPLGRFFTLVVTKTW
jgi:iron complex outermembrane receptor protein